MRKKMGLARASLASSAWLRSFWAWPFNKKMGLAHTSLVRFTKLVSNPQLFTQSFAPRL
jgi:hypothetical protein